MATVEGVASTTAAAYRTCRRMQRRHDPTYWLATSRLPAEVRPAVHALYGLVRIVDRAQLDAYMRGSAGAVGRMMAPLLGAREHADGLARMGAAFQLTNFIRDVPEDYALDRIYLPGARDEDVLARPGSSRL